MEEDTVDNEATEEVTHIERWMYAGTALVGTELKDRRDSWVPLPATDLDLTYKFQQGKKPSPLFVVGSEYDVKVSRDETGTTMHGTPRYVCRHHNEELRALAEARHKPVQTYLRLRAMMADDKKNSALEAALEPLVRISAQLGPFDRAAFATHVMQRIMKPWMSK